MFALGGALRLREGVELSSGNSFPRQPENKPWCCSGDLAGPACSPRGTPVAPLARDGSWPCMAPPAAGGPHGICSGISQLNSCRLLAQKSGLCGSDPSYKFDLWVWAWGFCVYMYFFFLLVFLFQLWSNKSFPELTQTGPKNRNAASAAAPAKRADQQLQGRKYPQDPAAKSNT